MKQIIITMDFNEEEVADGFDEFMLNGLKHLLHDKTGRTDIRLVDVDVPDIAE